MPNPQDNTSPNTPETNEERIRRLELRVELLEKLASERPEDFQTVRFRRAAPNPEAILDDTLPDPSHPAALGVRTIEWHEASRKTALERERKEILRFWLLPTAFIGLVFGTASLWQAWQNWLQSRIANVPTKSGSLMDWIIPHAYAAEEVTKMAYSPEIKSLMILGVFATVFLFFVWSLGVVMFSRHAETRSFALDTLKTLTGFYIGIATTFLA